MRLDRLLNGILVCKIAKVEACHAYVIPLQSTEDRTKSPEHAKTQAKTSDNTPPRRFRVRYLDNTLRRTSK